MAVLVSETPTSVMRSLSPQRFLLPIDGKVNKCPSLVGAFLWNLYGSIALEQHFISELESKMIGSSAGP